MITTFIYVKIKFHVFLSVFTSVGGKNTIWSQQKELVITRKLEYH